MDLKQLVILAAQVSILATVFGFGLKSTPEDLLYLLRRPGLLSRAILSVFIIMPFVAVALVNVFDFPQPVGIILIALAISPVPPLLPRKQEKAGGHTSFSLGLMAFLSLTSIVAVPIALVILQALFQRPLSIPEGAVTGLVLKVALAPLLTGMAVRGWLPAIADRLERPVNRVVRVLLPVAIVALLAGSASDMWAHVGTGTLIAMTVFTVVGLAIGHIFGKPDPDHSLDLALSTACRHPAIALTIATASFPDEKFGPIILLFLVVNAIVGIPYLKWQGRYVPRVVRAA